MRIRWIALAPLPLLLLLTAVPLAARPASWVSRGPGGGGALFQPSLSPHAPDELHVACDMSELFRTDDFGRTWRMLDFRVIGGGRPARVCYTPDPNVLYTIDCKTLGRRDYLQPVKSTDGGLTWRTMPGVDPFFDALDVMADPHDARRLFLVDYSDLYVSQDGGDTLSASVFSDATGGGGVRLAGIFTDGQLVLLGTNNGLLISNDGGRTFVLNGPIAGIDTSAEAMTGFAAAKDPATGAIRMVAVTQSMADGVWLGMTACDYPTFVSVYTMTWGDPAWTPSNSGLRAGDRPFYAGMSEGDVNVMWLSGGTDAGEPLVARSTDSGRTWGNVFSCTGNANIQTGWSGDGGDRGWGYGECAEGFGVSPVDPLRAAISDYGFVHVTRDGGATWQQAYVDPSTQHPAGAPTPTRRYYATTGLENTSAWCMAWVDSQAIMAGYSDIRACRSEDGGATWGFDYQAAIANSAYEIVRRPSDGRMFAATSNVHDLYRSSRYLQDGAIDAGSGNVLFSTDGGSTWQVMHDFGAVVDAVALHPTQPDTLYAAVADSATGGIYVTRNAGAGAASTWVRLANPPRTQGHPWTIRVLDDGTLVTSWSGRLAGSFTASAGVFVSTDDGQSWLDRSDARMQYRTLDVVVDPHDASQSTWYAGVYWHWGSPNDDGNEGLYRTTDRGQTWQHVFAGADVGSITISPTDPDEAWMTTQTDGLWHCSNLRAASPVFDQDAAYPFRQPTRVYYDPYVAGRIWVTSFGHGLMAGDEPAVASRNLRRATAPALSFATLPSILPLTAADVILADVVPGDLDPDATIVGDATRPLAFYDVDDPAAIIRVTKTGARRIRVDF